MWLTTKLPSTGAHYTLNMRSSTWSTIQKCHMSIACDIFCLAVLLTIPDNV